MNRPLRTTAPPVLHTMADRLRAARVARGMSQAELAEKVSRKTGRKTGKTAVSKWESETTKNPEISTFFAVGDVTGFSPEWLATGAGPMRQEVAKGALDGNALRAAIVAVFPGATEHQLKTVSTVYGVVAAGTNIDAEGLQKIEAAVSKAPARAR